MQSIESSLHSGEKIVYRGGPSQIVNYNNYVVCLLFFIAATLTPWVWTHFLAADYMRYKALYMLASKIAFFIPVIMAFSAWIRVRSHKYTITTERLIEEIGVFSKITDELELFRVKDITFVQPFSLRVFGCGNIILDTSDKSTPIVVVHAIKNARPVIESLRQNVQIMRTKKGVREIDS